MDKSSSMVHGRLAAILDLQRKGRNARERPSRFALQPWRTGIRQSITGTLPAGQFVRRYSVLYCTYCTEHNWD
jgi:hypothetical protein